MYNLAKREGLPKIGDTPDNVAANTYIFDSYKTFKQNYAGFLSKTEREFVIGRKLWTQAVYNVETPAYHVKGGSSIKNRALRNTFVVTEGPGPGDYDPKKPDKRIAFATNVRPPGRGKLYMCAPPRDSQGIPSIPTKIDENGYYIDEHGHLVKNLCDDNDTSLGPAFYHIEVNPFYGTNKYKGCEWSKRRAKRSTMDIKDGPGPGMYSLQTDEIGRMDPNDEYVREMARLFSFVPRSIEAAEMRTIREDLPGPGHYDTNKTTLKLHKTTGIYPVPFVVGARRFRGTESDGPGPADYDAKCPKRRPCSLINTPFGITAKRTRSTKSAGPGPAEYCVLGDIETRFSKKRKTFFSVDTAFNSSAERKMDFVGKDTLHMPSPDEYIVEPLEMPKSSVYCCRMRSKTERFPNLADCENAEPATYDISETYNKNRDRKSHNTGKVPFQAKQPKCIQLIPDYPSPADYLGHKGFTGRNLSFQRSPRFKDPHDNYPGPGAYQIHPSHTDSVYKTYTTLNLRLKENVQHQKLRLPPGKTWHWWYKHVRTPKQLVCFAEPTDNTKKYDYVRMLFKDSEFK